MTTNYVGNAIPAPSYVTGGQTVDDELLYSANNYEQKGVTLEPGKGVLLLGTILGRITATKRYTKYSSGASDGSQVALGVLRNSVDTGSSSSAQVFQGNILHAGLLKLAAMSSANSGVAFATVLNGVVNNVEGYFKF